MKTLIFTLLIISATSSILAQTCQQKLEDAKRAWFNGQLREVENLLEGCLDKELAKDDRFAAYKHMVDARLLLNEDADVYMQQLLALNPNYQPKAVDLAEFKQLYGTYDLRTKYAFGITAGILRPDYVIIKQHSYSGQAIQANDYDEQPGFTLGLNGSYELVKSFYADAALLFQQRSFKQQEELMNFRKVSSTQRDYLLTLPLQLKYLVRIKKVGLLIGGGYALDYLLKSEADIDHWPLNTGIFAVNGVPFSVKSYNLTEQQTRWSHNWLVSGAAFYQFSQFMLQLEFAYTRGLTNQVIPANRYDDPVLLETYAYVPDDYKVNSYTVTVKLLRYIAKPYKKRK
jgi:hypothetical protein